MKKTNALLLAATTLGLGFAAFTTTHTETAHAAYYSWSKTKAYSRVWPLKQKKSGTTAYMWNDHHTAKLHNLKNYPGALWNLSRSVKMTYRGKSSFYYKITSENKKVSGYVWRGYLTNYNKWSPVYGIYSPLLTDDKSYSQYLNQSPQQKLAKAVLALFPNTPVSLDLSKYAIGQAATSMLKGPVTSGDGFSSKTDLLTSGETLYYLINGSPKTGTIGITTQDRLNKIKEELDQLGYTAEKRASLSGKWRLGICFYDHIDSYMGVIDESGYALMIAKQD